MTGDRFIYRAHGWLTCRMFARTPPRLRWYERAALWLVRRTLDAVQAHDMRRA